VGESFGAAAAFDPVAVNNAKAPHK
jgi:hypothetical protein